MRAQKRRAAGAYDERRELIEYLWTYGVSPARIGEELGLNPRVISGKLSEWKSAAKREELWVQLLKQADERRQELGLSSLKGR